jgi:hypothetical protein
MKAAAAIRAVDPNHIFFLSQSASGYAWYDKKLSELKRCNHKHRPASCQ